MRRRTKPSRNQKLVIIVGNIGSGKSTALPLVAKTLKAGTLYADELFQKKDPFAKSYLNEINRWAFTNELWMTIERAKLLREHLKKTKKKITVVDSGLLISWVFTYSHFAKRIINRHEWELYQRLYKHIAADLVRSCTVIYLDYPIRTLMERIKKRGRDYELKYYTEEYLKQIRVGLRKLIQLLKQEKTTIIHIKEAQVADFENNPKDRKLFLTLVKKAV